MPRTFLAATLILAGSLATHSAGTPSVGTPSASVASVGYVLDMVGIWKASSVPQPLAIGRQLPAGSTLMNENPVSRDYIIVANLNGDVIRTIRCRSGVCRECRTDGGCYDPIRPLPDAPPSENRFATAWRVVLELFGERPDHYSLHRVRDSGFALNRDGVVAINESVVDLTALLRDQEEGAYELRCVVIPFDSMTTPVWKSKPVKLEWLPGRKATPAFEGLHPGLFLLRAKHNDETGTAWILVVPAAHFAEWNGRFEEFVSKTDSWGDSVSPEMKRSYQRAYLDYLNSLYSGQANLRK